MNTIKNFVLKLRTQKYLLKRVINIREVKSKNNNVNIIHKHFQGADKIFKIGKIFFTT